jgi:nucleotide-binding universal stress UspA family protein
MGGGQSERRLASDPEKETEMSTDTRGRRIVVGYDGSPASGAALTCAAERAGEDGRIYIVHAYSLPSDWLGAANYADLMGLVQERAQTQLDRIEEESGADLAGVEWETEMIGDAPAPAIARVAKVRHADEIIVGTRGFGRARALFGSVAHELIHLAECSITVIPERVVDRRATTAQVGATT